MVRNLLRGLALGLGLLGAIGTANAADELAYFREQLAPFTKKPAFVPPGPAFNARQCMKGKSIFSIPVSSANPFTANIEKAMAASANQVGFKFISWENQGQNSQWVQGMNAAINQNVSLIDLLGGTDPRTLVPQVMEARAHHIPVVASHFNGLEQSAEVKKWATADVPIDYYKAGQLLVDWAALQTKGKLNAITLISGEIFSTTSMMNGINDELKKHCPGCKQKVINVAVVDWGTRITPNVRSALLADPSINYIMVIYDSMSQFVVPAVTLTNSENRVKIDAFNGTPFVLGLVQQGKVQMDIGENLDWIGRGIIDDEMRLLCGLPMVNPRIPFYIFTKENAKDAGTPPQLSKGYGNAYIEGYAKLWELK